MFFRVYVPKILNFVLMISLDIAQQEVAIKDKKKIMYYLRLARRQRLDFEKMCQLISERTTLNAYEVEFVLSVLQDVAIENLQLGRGVNLEELGVFSPNFKTKGEYDLEKVSADNIQQVVVNFRPAAKFRKEMDNAPVKKTSRFNLKHE